MGDLTVVTVGGDTVLTRKHPNGEESWRRAVGGNWSKMNGHKGPWISIKLEDVPVDVLRCYAEYVG